MAKIEGRTLVLCIAALVSVELILNSESGEIWHPLLSLGLARLIEIVLLGMIVILYQGNLSSVGLTRATLFSGIKRGATWSVCIGAAVGVFFVVFFLAGVDPLNYIYVELPSRRGEIFLLFIVGGIIGPCAEELFFRGLLFGFLLRWGFIPAALISSAIFAIAHFNSTNIFIPQVLGGLLLAAAYNREKTLVVPITIHTTANMAIFAISLIK